MLKIIKEYELYVVLQFLFFLYQTSLITSEIDHSFYICKVVFSSLALHMIYIFDMPLSL